MTAVDGTSSQSVDGPVVVLLVADDGEFRRRASEGLAGENERLSVPTERTVEGALDRLAAGGVDCVVGDDRLADRDGLALFEAVRRSAPDLPFVLLARDGSESLAREALAAGVTDYVEADGAAAFAVLANRVVRAVEGHHARRALGRQADLFDRTQRLASVGGWEYDLRTGTLRWTDEMRRIYGVDEDHTPTLDSAIEFYHPDDRERVRAAFEAAVEDGEPYDHECRIVTGDGEERWVHARGARQDEEGKPAYLRGSIQDVTDRKRRERRLRESKATIEALHRAAPEIAGAETPGAVAERTVEAAETLLEFRLCSVLLHDGEGVLEPAALSEGAPPDGVETVPVEGPGSGLAGRTFRTGESEVIDRVEPDDGTEPARDDYRSGISVPVGDHGVFQAVATEFEAFDEGDVELAELLVAHAASALDRIERERELRRQNERLDQFARVVSHDLRNPIEVVQAEVSLARDSGDLSHLDGIEDALGRMDRIIDDLLSLGRAGKRVGDRRPVDLASVVRETWGTVETGDAELRVELPDGFTLEADRGRLRQAVANLVRNGTEHGGEAVTVRVGATATGFYVEDDGPGIPEDERAAVFEAGHTGDDGTGLGLAIVREIAEAHGWTVTATAGRDGGARFEFDTGGGE